MLNGPYLAVKDSVMPTSCVLRLSLCYFSPIYSNSTFLNKQSVKDLTVDCVPGNACILVPHSELPKPKALANAFDRVHKSTDACQKPFMLTSVMDDWYPLTCAGSRLGTSELSCRSYSLKVHSPPVISRLALDESKRLSLSSIAT